MTRKLHVSDDADSVACAAAEALIVHLGHAIRTHGRALLALAGGRTPEALYRRLAAPDQSARIDWPHVVLIVGDERCVPVDHPDSNEGMIRHHLLDRLPTAPAALLGWHYHGDPQAAVNAFSHAFAALDGGVAPRLDIALLGLGRDGHTASLFPQQPCPPGIAAVTHAPDGQPRMTLGHDTLAAARARLFLACGRDKAHALGQVWQGTDLPATTLADAEWFVDEAAAIHADDEM